MRTITFVLSLALAGAALTKAAPPAEVQPILKETGVRGGLLVHLGCGEGKLTMALHANDSYLVQGLDADPVKIAQARQNIQKQGLYGEVTAEVFTGARLPYVDNLVNLLVVEDAGGVGREEMLRVLCPNGVAVFVNPQSAFRNPPLRKPRPAGIDRWTHYLHDAGNNAVAHDTVVGPPRQYQWTGSPRWSRHHDTMASVSAMVCDGARNFYIMDDGSTASVMLPSKWALTARDAFNGTILWKQPIATWHPQLYPFKSGPTQLTRRLVADGNYVYAPLGREAPLSILDAATGRILRTVEATRAVEEVLVADDVAFVLANSHPADWSKFHQLGNVLWPEKIRVETEWQWDEKPRRIVALQPETGNVLWQKEAVVMPLTLTVDARAVYFHDGKSLVCLDRKDGKQLWRSEPVSRKSFIPTYFGATLVAYGDVLLFAGGDGVMSGVSAKTGKKLWSAPHQPGGHNSPQDLLVVGGLVWSGAISAPGDSGVFTGRDPLTGAVKNEFAPDTGIHFMHQRCYRAKATDKFLIPSRTGIEYIDPTAKHWTLDNWVRSGCVYGVMPCNGLTYTTPHDCACYLETKLFGFCALAPAAAITPAPTSEDQRLTHGPAYAQISNLKSEISNLDWPTYRHDGARSGCTRTEVPTALKSTWQTPLGGKLSAPVVADGKLFIAQVETHKVCALNLADGRLLWSFTAGGRVDSPPTFHQSCLYFGAADGCVYCVRASDGALAWRFQAAPQVRWMTSFEQVESVWPVPGSALVKDGVVHCVAGRSMFLDGGLRLLQLDAASGCKLSEVVLDDKDPATGKDLQSAAIGVGLPDILSTDGQFLFMRSQPFDLAGKRQELAPKVRSYGGPALAQRGEGQHLFSPTGFLDDTWWHRSYWVYGRSFAQGSGGWPLAGRVVPGGRILAMNDQTVYGYGRRPDMYKWTTPIAYHLFAASKQQKANTKAVAARDSDRPQVPTIALQKKAAAQPKAGGAKKSRAAAKQKENAIKENEVTYTWSQAIPLQVRAMVLAQDTLFIAGPPEVVDEEHAFAHPEDQALQAKLKEEDEIQQGAKGFSLWAVATTDGRKLAEYHFDSVPVFDGLIAAQGRLYLATVDGNVLCLQ